jgi:hypothetical protein
MDKPLSKELSLANDPPKTWFGSHPRPWIFLISETDPHKTHPEVRVPRFLSHLRWSLIFNILISNKFLSNTIFIQKFEQPFTEQTFILDFQVLDAKAHCSLGWQIIGHLTNLYFFFLCWSFCQKNHDLKYSSFFKTSLEISKKESMNIGRPDKIELINTNLPPTDSIFPFQQLSFFFSNLSCVFFPILVIQFLVVHEETKVLTWIRA